MTDIRAPRKKEKVKRFLTIKKSVVAGAGAAIIALAVPGIAAIAQGATLPADQIVLNGSCLSVDDVLAAAQQAMAAYVLGGPPAGVIINNNWVPAAFLASNEGEYAVNLGCAPIGPPASTASDPASPPTTTDPTTTTTDPTTTTTDPTTTTTVPTWHRHHHGHHHDFGH
jgi:hypothetical protein